MEKRIIVGSKNYKLEEFLKPSVWSATHSTKGIFIASGKHIRQGRIKPISTMDITPNEEEFSREEKDRIQEELKNLGYL